MAIYAQTPKRSYAPAPEGDHHATLVKIADLGISPKATWDNAKPRVQLVWQLDTLNPQTGDPYEVSEFFNNSLFKNRKAASRLRERVEAILARELTAAEAEPEGFDLETLLGTEATLTIRHDTGDDGKTWARVQAVKAAEHIPF